MRLPRFANSILFRLLLSAVGIVLLGAALRYTLLWNFLRDDLESLVATQQMALANYVAKDIDQRIQLRRSVLARLAAALPRDLLRQPDRLRTWLRDHQEYLPLFALGVVVVDPSGTVVADYPVIPGRAGYDMHQTPELAALLSDADGVGRPLFGPVSKQPVLPISARIRDADGTVRGTLVGIEALAAPGMLDPLLGGRVGESGGLLLISPRDSLFVAASDPSLILKPTPPPGVNPLHDRAMAGYRGTGSTVNAKGIEELSAIVSVPGTGWFVVARLPTTEAFAMLVRVQAYVLRSSLIIAIVALLLVGGVVWWLLKPLFDAARHAEDMTLGEAPLEPLKVVRDDEVGHLTDAFNRLLLKLIGSQEALERMAHHDSLTGLPNRRLLADRLTRALARARRSHQHVAVLFMDLDGFKPINDTLGHETGDEALCIVTQRFAAAIRENDTLARVGGDEFVLLISDLAGSVEEIRHAVEAIAAKCLARISEPLLLRERPMTLGVSIGIAISDDASTPDSLMNAADDAMYEAKRRGRGCYVMAS